jgi:hypothetical protein
MINPQGMPKIVPETRGVERSEECEESGVRREGNASKAFFNVCARLDN